MTFFNRNILATVFLMALFTTACGASEVCDGEIPPSALETADAGDDFDLAALCESPDLEKSEYLFKSGLASRQQRKLHEAARLLESAARYNPDSEQISLELAVTYEWLGYWDQALEIYRSILSQKPHHLAAGTGIARLTHWQGYLKKSIRLYADLLGRYSMDIGVRVGLALALLADLQLEKADQMFSEILALDADNPDAVRGLEMLREIRRNRMQISLGYSESRQEANSQSLNLDFSRQESYATKWGIALTMREIHSSPAVYNSVPANTEIGSSASAFIDIKWNAKDSTFLQYTDEEIEMDNRQQKFQVEYMRVVSSRHRAFAGVVPAWRNGAMADRLSYLGYIFIPNRKHSLTVQYFNNESRQFADSNALALSATKNFNRFDYWKLGASVSENGTDSISSVFGESVYHLNRNFSLKGSFVANLTTDQTNINLGVLYEF